MRRGSHISSKDVFWDLSLANTIARKSIVGVTVALPNSRGVYKGAWQEALRRLPLRDAEAHLQRHGRTLLRHLPEVLCGWIYSRPLSERDLVRQVPIIPISLVVQIHRVTLAPNSDAGRGPPNSTP